MHRTEHQHSPPWCEHPSKTPLTFTLAVSKNKYSPNRATGIVSNEIMIIDPGVHANRLAKIPANLVIIGPAGVGKTHVATALCHDAVMKGRQTVFVSLFDLTAKLVKAKNVYSLIDYYARVPVLCLDELGYVIPSKDQADAIFQIVSKRTETGTTIVTTNLVPSDWGKIFDTATASAILDRLSLNGRFITFEGRSYRSKK